MNGWWEWDDRVQKQLLVHSETQEWIRMVNVECLFSKSSSWLRHKYIHMLLWQRNDYGCNINYKRLTELVKNKMMLTDFECGANHLLVKSRVNLGENIWKKSKLKWEWQCNNCRKEKNKSYMEKHDKID